MKAIFFNFFFKFADMIENISYDNFTVIYQIKSLTQFIFNTTLSINITILLLNFITGFILIMSRNMNTKFFHLLKIYIISSVTVNVNNVVVIFVFSELKTLIYTDVSFVKIVFNNFKAAYYYTHIYSSIWIVSFHFASIFSFFKKFSIYKYTYNNFLFLQQKLK